MTAVPSLFNPRGHDAFTVVKTGLIEGLGPPALFCAIFLLLFQRRTLLADSLVRASAAVALTIVVATAASVLPALSFFAPGVRHEGTFVALSLIAIGLAIATAGAEHLELLVSAIVVGSIGPSVVAVTQTILHALDPATSNLAARVGSTFGNPVLFGGYLATVIPITAAKVLQALMQDGRRGGRAPFSWNAIGWWAVLGVQMLALFVVQARGAWIATAVAAVVIGAGAMRPIARRRMVVVLVAGSLALAFVLGPRASRGDAMLGSSRTIQVRLLIWRDVAHLLRARPSRLMFGYGPEMLGSVIGEFRAPDLAALEGPFAVSDRAHNDLLDTIVTTGLCGAAAMIVLHVLLWIRLRSLLASSQAAWTTQHWTILGLLAAAVAHFVDSQFGVANVASRLTWWCIVGLAVALGGDAAAVRENGTRDDTATALASAVAVAALTFSFWQPQADVSFAPNGLSMLLATGVIAGAIGAGGRPATWRFVAGRLLMSAASAATMAVVLSWVGEWDRDSTTVGAVMASGQRWSHQAAACYVLLGVAAAAVGLVVGSRTKTLQRRGLSPVALVAALLSLVTLVAAARTVRADMLAHLADIMKDARRWPEAEALQRRRTELTPESDVAWSALGGSELDLARDGAAVDRADRFASAVSALAEARRRSPSDWLHCRNQASAERLWAAADPADRGSHLQAADEFYRQASTLAPSSSTLWAEWGNVDAERGALTEALAKLERAAVLGDAFNAVAVADAILRATGVDVTDAAGLAGAAARLKSAGHPTLAALYATRASTRR